MTNPPDIDQFPEEELAWADGSATLLRSFLAAAATVSAAKTPPDLHEGICRALAAHGLPALVLVHRADTGQCQVLAHRLGLQPPPRWHDLPGIEPLLTRPSLLPPHAHPLAGILPTEAMLGLPSLSAPFPSGEDGRTALISVFAAHLVSSELPAIEALAALLGTTAARIQTGLRLHDLTLRLEQRVRGRTDELSLLYELSSALAGAEDDRAATELTVQAATRAFACDAVAALTCLERRHTAVLVARGAVSPGLHGSIMARLTERLDALAGAEHAGCTPVTLQVLDTVGRRTAVSLDGPLGSFTATPVLAAGRVSGILALLNLQSVQYAPEHMRLLATTAGQLGAAIERLRAARFAERERLAALVEGLPDGVVLLGADMRIHAANGTGRDRLALLRSRADEEPVPAPVAALAARTLARDRTESADLTTGSEPPRIITVTAHRIAEVTGEPAVVLALHDSTEASLMRERLFQSEKMASVGQLVSGVAHELNNPLTGIMGFAQLLLAHGLDATAEQQVATIFGEAERASKIVQNLLSFARRRRPEKVNVNVHALIERIVALREYELKVNDIDLDRLFAPDLPESLADPHQLQQVLLNILTNAEHAVRTRERPRRITIITSSSDGFVRIAIEDNGPGIAPEHLRRVFDPFFTTKPVGEGTGLGLTICYGIIDEHGGRIDVESRPGAGATVAIELPLAPSDGPELPAPASSAGSVFRPHAILVVDDEQAIQDLLTGILTMDGHVVETARTGAEALTWLAARHFDAVITDIRMPEMDGITFYHQVQERDPALARRIIFTSGDTVNRETRAFIQSTDIPFLPKPFTIGSVREIVKSVLDEAPAPR